MRDDDIVLILAGTLLPGGAGFPPFAATQAGALLLQRLTADDAARLLAALRTRGPAPDESTQWTKAACRLEAVEPELFTEFRRQVYLVYYEQPPVIAAIRALGHPYNDAPLPNGYPTEAFDPARDAPRHGRGRWIDTDDVRPVNLAGLDLESLR